MRKRKTRLLMVALAALLVAAIQVGAGEAPGAAAAFPGENGRVAYVDGGVIKTAKADGTDVKTVVPGFDPAWSADGTKIAFSRNSDIFTVNPDGSGEQHVTNDPESDSEPAWSPDGSKIAFTSRRGGDDSSHVWVIASSGVGSPQKVDSGLNVAGSPTWSPDGTKILFSGNLNTESNRPGVQPQGGTNSLDLYTVPGAGGPTTNLTNTVVETVPGSAERQGSWSPDGTQIAFITSTDINDVWVMNANGSGRHRLTNDTVPETEVVWSPDGSRLLVVRPDQQGGIPRIVSIDLAGGNDFPLGLVGQLIDWAPTPGILQLEFTQAVQVLQSVSALQRDLAGDGEPPVAMVAGKETALRVYFNDVQSTTDFQVELTGEITASDQVTIAPGCSIDDGRRDKPNCGSLDYYFTPPQGNWFVRVKVSELVSGDVVLDETFSLTSRDTSGLIIKYLPICVKLTAGAVPTCPTSFASSSTAAGLMQKIYPVADNELFYDPLGVPNMILEQPVSANGASNLLASLRQRYNLMSQGGFVADQVAGWLPDGGGAYAGISDPIWAGSTGRVSWQEDSSASDALDTQHTFSHEIGHNLGLRHTNLGDSCGSVDPSTPWPYADSTIQEVGFDVADQKVMLPTQKDLMTYCSPPGTRIWVSPFTYAYLMDGDFNPQRVSASGTPSQQLVIKGTAQADGSSATIDSVYTISSADAPDAPNPSGNYCLRTSGGAQADYCFMLRFQEHRSGDALESETFTLRIPLPASTTRLALLRGEQELAAVEASANAPTVNVSEPAELRGEETITWTGADGDSDALTYAVMYSPDGGATWLPLAVDITEPSLTLDTSVLDGSDVLLRVLASDGLNTTIDTTAPITLITGIERKWGDANCNGAVNIGDSIAIARSIVGLDPGQPEGCPEIGSAVVVDGSALTWGNVDCGNGNPNIGDSIVIARFLVGLAADKPECPDIGATVSVEGG